MSNEKITLTSLGKIEDFKNVFKKLMTDKVLTGEERSFILQCAFVFIEEYRKDTEKRSFFELAYYIVAKYSVLFGDYQPLYDFSFNYGFYPTNQLVLNEDFLTQRSIVEVVKSFNIKKFSFNEFVETFQQKKNRENILATESKEVSYIAPTSFGKSSIITELIKLNNHENSKHAIIVPTKSLLFQTYRNVKNEITNTKIIIHDEMFSNDENFVAVFTQERAIRLLESVTWAYDYLYIDEAHNIYNDDLRNIVLTRLIRLNKNRNPNCKIIYLSPLIASSKNLMLSSSQQIEEFKIFNNIKIPEYYVYDSEKNISIKYNRFFNEYYVAGNEDNYFKYIRNNSTEKTLIYFNRPKHIEQFVDMFAERINRIKSTKEVREFKKILKRYVHKNFKMVSLLDKGLVYLHGKIPDLIKDYVEYKFRDLSSLKYLVANSVILEGINLPLSSLFVLDAYSLTKNRLVNLVGRINRLSDIFIYKKDLRLLFPQIHFVEGFENSRGEMTTYVERLRDTMVIDEIENPLLENFRLKLKKDGSPDEAALQKIEKIKDVESKYFNESNLPIDITFKKLITFGLQILFKINEENFCPCLLASIKKHKRKKKTDPFDRIHSCFIEGIAEFIHDIELKLLLNAKTKEYYKKFLKFQKINSLKKSITMKIRNYRKKITSSELPLIYVGSSYGEVDKSGNHSNLWKENTYINLRGRNENELTNIAIIDIKREEDFVSFRFNKLIEFAYDSELISLEEYNNLTYGTNNIEQLKLIKHGLPSTLINKLTKDNQLVNVSFNESNIACGNENFAKYVLTQDDYSKFMIGKYINT